MKYLTILLVFCVITLNAQNYTLEFAPVVNAYVGQPVTISVLGTSSTNHVARLSLYGDNQSLLPYPGWVNCQTFLCDSLLASVSYTAQYPGPVKFQAVLLNSAYAFAAETTLVINFVCADDYCPANPLIGDFASWMRKKGYEECIISKYLENYENVDFRSGILDFLDTRPAATAQVMNVDFYDIIPTDSQATYLSMDAGEGGNCQYNPNFPDACPSSIPADYLYLEKHFEKTFGIDINFIYHRIDTSYVTAIGAPSLINGSYYRFPDTYQFLQQFPTRSIIHWSAQIWNGLFIDDMTGGSRVLESSFEPFNTLGLVTYTHEWGHTWGLPHSFIYNGNNFVGYALDGIMSNTYPIGSSELILDCLDPLERFALEPANGFLDSATFVDEYNHAIITVPGGLLNSCGNVDPAAISAQVINETPTTYTVTANLTNYGTIFAGCIKVIVINNGNTLESRLISIYPSQPLQLSFTIDKSSLIGTNVQIILDPANEISDEDETNNTLSFDIRCDSPTNLSVSDITSTSVNISWQDAVGTGYYQIGYRYSGGSGSLININGTLQTTLSNLLPGKTYEVEVKRLCNNTVSEWVSATFTTNCNMPQAVTVNNITMNGALISWSDPGGIGNYIVDFRPAGGNWTSFNVTGSLSTSVGNLHAGTTYDVSVKRVCEIGESPYTNITSFTTVCPAPTSLTTVQFSYYSANFSWISPGAAFTNFVFEYRESAGSWNTKSVQGTSTTITVKPGKTYEARIKTECDDNASSYSNVVTFTTPNYCASAATSASNDWISLVKLGNTLNNSSGNNGGAGYHDYTSLNPPNLQAGSSFALEFKAGQTGFALRNHTFRAWIDFNRDGDLTDANELIIFTTTSSSSVISMGFTVPSVALPGLTRMRVSMAYNSLPNPCSAFSSGEVEDYNVNIIKRIVIPIFREKTNPETTEENDTQVHVYPSPVKTILNIETPDHLEAVNLRVFDLTGKQVYNGEYQPLLDVEQWSSGIYLLMVGSKEMIHKVRFVKE